MESSGASLSLLSAIEEEGYSLHSSEYPVLNYLNAVVRMQRTRMDKDGRITIGEHIENVQAAEDLVDRSGGSTTGIPPALKILPPAYQGLCMFFVKSDHPDDQRIEIFNPSEPTDEETSRMSAHVRDAIKAAYLLFSLPNDRCGKLKEDLHNQYAAGNDSYCRSPSKMQSYIVNWRNRTGSRPGQTVGGLAFATEGQIDDANDTVTNEHVFYNDQGKLVRLCYICKSDKHLMDKCPERKDKKGKAAKFEGEAHALTGAFSGMDVNDYDMIGDFFTKPLQGSLFRKFRALILNTNE